MTERRPVLDISLIAINAVKQNYQRTLNDTLLAALTADGLSAADGWQFDEGDGKTWVRTVADPPTEPSH